MTPRGARLVLVPDRFDKAALQADGSFTERIDDLVLNLPDDLADLARESDNYSAGVRGAYNAGDAGGSQVSNFTELT
jgi:hypothetical protein